MRKKDKPTLQLQQKLFVKIWSLLQFVVKQG